jgi:hypothetical protein
MLKIRATMFTCSVFSYLYHSLIRCCLGSASSSDLSSLLGLPFSTAKGLLTSGRLNAKLESEPDSCSVIPWLWYYSFSRLFYYG